MKVHLIKKLTIKKYTLKHANARKGFKIWLDILKTASWEIPEDILNTYVNADILGGGSKRVVFDVGGNKFRLICSYYFGTKEVGLFIKWIGTHAEYTKLCDNEDQYTISNY